MSQSKGQNYLLKCLKKSNKNHASPRFDKMSTKIKMKFFVNFLKKIRINQARLSKRTCVSNEISKFYKKNSNLFFKNPPKIKNNFENFL